MSQSGNIRGGSGGGGGGGLTWVIVTENTQMLVNYGYIVAGETQLAMTLPLTGDSVLGDIIRITAFSPSGWSIVQNTDEFIQFGALNSTRGPSGSVTSTEIGDSIEIVYNNNGGWQSLSSMGTLVVV